MTASVELEFIRASSCIEQRLTELNVKLGAMRDMRAGCKLSVSEPGGTLYVDVPSVFQGATRWFYGQNRYVVVNDYLHREIMEKYGLIDLVVALRDKCAELFMQCSVPAATFTLASRLYNRPGSNNNNNNNNGASSISENTRKIFRALCASSIELLSVVGHGLGKLFHIYQPDLESDDAGAQAVSFTGIYKTVLTHFQELTAPPPPHPPHPHPHPLTAPESDAVTVRIQEMQRRVKFERIMLQHMVDKFDKFDKFNPT